MNVAVRRSFADVSVGEELPRVRGEITREQIRGYAEASGDDNPLHLDDGAARQAGMPGVIAHGMLTMGILATCICRWAGEAAALVSMTSAFRATVAPGETVTAGGRVRALDPDARTATLDVWVQVERADGAIEEPIRRSEAVVRLAE